MQEHDTGMAPFIVDARPSYLVVYKPPKMHTVPLHRPVPLNRQAPLSSTAPLEPQGSERGGETLLGWCARLFPEVLIPRFRNPWEGGMLHRLDYETEGLVLIARDQGAMDALLAAQAEGRFIKEYGAAAVKTGSRLRGSPDAPTDEAIFTVPSGAAGFPAIESGFRAWGPGGQSVRPVVLPEGGGGAAGHAALDRGKPYRTEILRRERRGDYTLFGLRIYRAFRHQIRCHLAWVGYPLLNDALYGGILCPGYPGLALRAQGISFPDPESGERREYELPPISLWRF